MIKRNMVHHSMTNYYTTIITEHVIEEYLRNLERIHDKYFCDNSLTYNKVW